MKKIKIVVSWLLVFSLMFVIFSFSNQESVASSNTSSGLTKTIFDFFELDKVLVFDPFHGLVRKVVHFGIYFLLGILIYNALSLTFNKSYIYLLISTIFIIICYASSDEFHQLFISGRSGEIRDVLIDTSGGSVGAMIYYLFAKVRGIKNDL